MVNKEAEEKYPKNCMFQDKLCNKSCRGWDYEHNDCRLLGMLWRITEAINYKLEAIKKAVKDNF